MSNDNRSLLPIELVADEPISQIRAGVPVSVFGMSFGERTHLAANAGFFVYVTTDYASARLAVKELSQWSGGAAALFPARADVLSFVTARDGTLPSERARALRALTDGTLPGIVTTPDALLQALPPPERYREAIVAVSKGEETDRDGLCARLTCSGYARREPAETIGQFSLHGDILDVFPFDGSAPCRIEFFGDFVESVKRIDPETRRTVGEEDGVVLPPACEFLATEEEALAAAKAMSAERTKGLSPDAEARLDRILGQTAGRLESGARDASLEFAFPYVPHTTLADYLPSDAVLVYDETKAILDRLLQTEKEHLNRYRSLLVSGEVLKSSLRQLLTFEEFKETYARFRGLSFARLTSSNLFFEPKRLYRYECAPITRYSMNFGELASDIRIWLSRGYRILLCGRDKDGAESVRKGLADQGLSADVGDPETLWRSERGVLIAECELERGCSYHEAKVIVIGSGELFPVKATRLGAAGNRRLFVQPAAGDYVVHYVHGIGKCLGTKRMTTSLGTKDYLEIEYRDGDLLYVPVDQMDLVTKYGGENPRLSKMGGKEFARAKEKAKAGIKQMAVDLVRLYGARQQGKGYAYAVDDALTAEFVARFPHPSTADQLAAFEEIRKDLRSGKIMDRLLVGDVGYGKTEVALRAAFAVMIDGKQAAMLAPTTILSEQHARTAKERFDEFGIRTAVLNRFSSPKEQRETLRRLAAGELDFVCGTHRLLGKDVAFKDLGLLILDEEQRFGVADKEKLKVYQNNVNVLSMTATPIPRTLHMSLSGIRDISTLGTPPADRLPVQTIVTEYTDGLAADCIRRELARGGQTFVVYNRVETIYRFADRLKTALPDVRFLVCHGQMNEAELEENVKRFYDGDADVLVTTTIIENGIDLPSANTLLVCDADRLGLSQLYQLRGRVGRSNRLAYAYFTYMPGKLLGESAEKRLEALTEFTEFGSGFKIAMRDLEIRGAGNVLGREQHGHMEKVGYDLYCKMLAEAVGELRGEETAAEGECEVVTDADAYLPDGYITDSEGRMTLYSRIAAIRTRSDWEKLLEELKDLYGPVPKPVRNLVTVGLYKGYGVRLGVTEIRITKTGARVTLGTVTEWAAAVLAAKNTGAVLKPSAIPIVVFERGEGSCYERVLRFLAEGLAAQKALSK